MRVRDSFDLAWQDWLGTAGFDREGRSLAAKMGRGVRGFRRRGEAVLAACEGVRFFPVVGWAERGGYGAAGPGIRFRGFISRGERGRESSTRS